MVNGITQLTTSSTAGSVRQARRLGVGTAAVLAAIDLVYVPARRISKMYLVDAAIEVGWIIAWCRGRQPRLTGIGNRCRGPRTASGNRISWTMRSGS
jgi:hypothetical protein